jgi:hypothetical protein
VDIFRQYGDHLYEKGDHSGAIDQYEKTIGTLEPSYVIRKFLDAQKIHSLTAYLQALHRCVMSQYLQGGLIAYSFLHIPWCVWSNTDTRPTFSNFFPVEVVWWSALDIYNYAHRRAFFALFRNLVKQNLLDF